jgi:hypothetical protein
MAHKNLVSPEKFLPGGEHHTTPGKYVEKKEKTKEEKLQSARIKINALAILEGGVFNKPSERTDIFGNEIKEDLHAESGAENAGGSAEANAGGSAGGANAAGPGSGSTAAGGSVNAAAGSTAAATAGSTAAGGSNPSNPALSTATTLANAASAFTLPSLDSRGNFALNTGPAKVS